MSSRIYLVILFVVLSCRLSYTNAKFRIVNGVGIRMQDSPWSVALFRRNRYRCVGTLVTLKSVITAANCVFGAVPSNLYVLAGMVDIREFNKGKGQQRIAQSIIRDPAFKPGSLLMDIAVVNVYTDFQCDLQVAPVYIWDSVLKPGIDMQVSGWGADALRVKTPYPILKTTTMTIKHKDQCYNGYANLRKPIILPDTIICAGASRSYLGFGDTGAGAIVDGKLCAVVYDGSGRFNMPFLFTDVTNDNVFKFLRVNIS